MKLLSLFLLTLLASPALHAQSFNGPESVDYDAVNKRWIVGQKGSGEIHVYDPETAGLKSLISGIKRGPFGIECAGKTVYCCSGSDINGYDLRTGEEVFSINTGGKFLNGLTWDGKNYLYATDMSGRSIYCINIKEKNSKLVVNDLPRSPNGIVYDKRGKRCVFVTWGKDAAIMQLNLQNFSVFTLCNTNLGNCDGITRDKKGYWYVTAWSNQSLNRFNPDFSGQPIPVLTGLSNPADIDIDGKGKNIAIPNSGARNVVLYNLKKK